MTVAQAQQVIREGRNGHSYGRLLIAAHKMMDACKRKTGEVAINDAFLCLQFEGAIATVGARCLYVLTGRDGIGWGDGPFTWDREDWETYLREHCPNSLPKK